MDSEESAEVQRLVEQARQHDEAAMGALLSTHAQRLLTSVRAELGERLRQRLESQDVMQQVYLDALNNIDKFVDQGHDSFFRWLRRIAVNRFCDVDRKAFKTEKRGKEVRVGDVGRSVGVDDSLLNLLDHIPAGVSGPVTVADRSDRIKLLAGALNRLSEDHREVLRLRYLEELSVEETAARMNRTDRAIRGLCVRALIRLRELLGNAV